MLPIPDPIGKADIIIKFVRDLGFPVVIAVVLLYSVLYQIPRNETAINNAKTALIEMNAKLDRCTGS